MLVNVTEKEQGKLKQKSNKCNTYGKVEDEDVRGVSHFLVKDDDKDDEEVTDKPDDDDEGEDDGDNNRNDSHQDLKVSRIHPNFLPSGGRFIYRCVIHIEFLSRSPFLSCKKMID